MDITFPMNESGADSSQQIDVRACRTINCGRDADDADVFCPRCREEIDAIREMARRRFVIFGTSATKRAV
jgi:hypothetical protein